MTPEERLEELGYPVSLPAPSPEKPYEPLVQIGRIVYGSGNTSMDRRDGRVFSGKVGADIEMEEAQHYARIAMVNALGGFKAHLGSLDRIRRFVRLTGYINSASDFTRQPEVLNAASQLLLDCFGDRGRHARSAIGVAQLPGGAAVEVEAIIEVDGE